MLAAKDRPSGRQIGTFVVIFFYDPNASIASVLVDLSRLMHREVVIVKDGIDFPLAIRVGMYFKGSHGSGQFVDAG